MMNAEDKQKKILLVEDDGDVRELYAEILREEGFEVIEEIEGERGLARIREDTFDLILLDIMLPKKDGLAILKELRELAGGELTTPVVLLTNLGQEAIITEGFDLGAKGYLIKSEYTPDQIVSEVRSFLK